MRPESLLNCARRLESRFSQPRKAGSAKLVGNLWILWKTQDSRLWNLWTTLPTSLLPYNPFAIIGPSQEPVHNCSVHLESSRSAVHIYLLSAPVRFLGRSRHCRSSDFQGPVATAIAVSTVAVTGSRGFPHSMGAFPSQTRLESRETAFAAFRSPTILSTSVESAVDKQGKRSS